MQSNHVLFSCTYFRLIKRHKPQKFNKKNDKIQYVITIYPIFERKQMIYLIFPKFDAAFDRSKRSKSPEGVQAAAQHPRSPSGEDAGEPQGVKTSLPSFQGSPLPDTAAGVNPRPSRQCETSRRIVQKNMMSEDESLFFSACGGKSRAQRGTDGFIGGKNALAFQQTRPEPFRDKKQSFSGVFYRVAQRLRSRFICTKFKYITAQLLFSINVLL